MWKWTCPKSPKSIWEHHSWTSLDESLSAHENGIKIPGFREFPPCEEDHNYWDDGEPCSSLSVKGFPNCKIPYVRNDEPVV